MENEVQIQSLVKKLLNIYNACKWSTSKLNLRKKKYSQKTKRGELRFNETSELDTETETRCHQRNIFVFTQTLPSCGKLNPYLADPRKTKSSYSLLKDYSSSSSTTEFRNDSSYQWVCRCDSNTSGHTYGNYHSVNVCTCPSCCCKRKNKYGTVDKKSITDIKGLKNNTVTIIPNLADETTITETDEAKEIQVYPRNVASTLGIMNTNFENAQTAPTGSVGCDCKCEFNHRSVACQSSPAPCRVCSTLNIPEPPPPQIIARRKSIKESPNSSSCSCSCEPTIVSNAGGCKCCPTGTAGTSCRQTCSLHPDRKCCCNKTEKRHSISTEIQREKIIIPSKYSIEDADPSLVLSEDVEKELLHESYRERASSNVDRIRNQSIGEIRPREKSLNSNRIDLESFSKRSVAGLQSAPITRKSIDVNANLPSFPEIPKDFFLNMKSCECSCPRCRKKDTIHATQTTNQIFENRIKDYYADFSQCLKNIPNNSPNHCSLLSRSSEIGTIDEGVNTFNNVVVQTYTSSLVEQHSADRLQSGACQQRNECCTCGKKGPPENQTTEDRSEVASSQPPEINESIPQPSQQQINLKPPPVQPPPEKYTRSDMNQMSPEHSTPVNIYNPPPRPPAQFPVYDSPTDPARRGGPLNCCCYLPEANDVFDSVGDGIGDGDPFPGLNDDTKEEIRDLLKNLEDTLHKESRLHKKNMTGIMKQLSKQAGEIKELKVHVKGVVESKRALTCEEVEKKIRKMDETKKKEARKRKEEQKKKKAKKVKEPKDHESSTCCKCDKNKKKSVGCCGECCANRCCGCCGTCCGGCCVDFCDCCCGPCEKMCPCCCACAECCDKCWSCSCFSSNGNQSDQDDRYVKCKCR